MDSTAMANSSVDPISPSTSPVNVGDSSAAADDDSLFVPMAAVMSGKLLLAILTVITDGSLIYVTAKSRNLHEPCNLLLAANSLCISLYSCSFFIQFIALLIAGTQGISVRLCCLLQSLPIVGNYGQYTFFALIALDRLISVIFPIWAHGWHVYIKHRQIYYLFGLFSLGFGYGFVASASSIAQSFSNPDRTVLCETGTSTPQMFSNIGMVLSISSATFYLTLFVAFKIRQSFNPSDLPSSTKRDNEYTRRLFRSLIAMFLLEFFGWSANQIATKVLNFIGPPANQRWFIKSYVGYLTQLTLLLYAPTLYLLSNDYGQAFRKTFWPQKVKPTTVVTPVPVQISSQRRHLSMAPFTDTRPTLNAPALGIRESTF